MYLNTLKPAPGSKPSGKRVGRGIGSTLGKTCGTGHKGQKSRSGGFHKTGFEGGQMPVQRRLPKFGFSSRQKAFNAQVTLNELVSLADSSPIDLSVLKSQGIVPKSTLVAKIILSGKIDVAVLTKGLKYTKSAKEAILAAGGTVED